MIQQFERRGKVSQLDAREVFQPEQIERLPSRLIITVAAADGENTDRQARSRTFAHGKPPFRIHPWRKRRVEIFLASRS
jgi:hypothetical protein